MGTPVTIDSDDLQVLLFCTGGIKQVEQSIKNWGTDPLKLQYGEKFAEVHDRAADLMRGAQRVVREDLAHMHTPATPSELIQIEEIFKRNGRIEIVQRLGEPLIAFPVATPFQVDQIDHRSLRMRGFLEIGTLTHRIEWGDSKWENLSSIAMMGRLTKRALGELFPVRQHGGLVCE